MSDSLLLHRLTETLRLNPKSRDEGDEQEEHCTKIYYASRTHSQLSQIVPEVMRLRLTPSPPSSRPTDPIGPMKTGSKRPVPEDSEPAKDELIYPRVLPLGSRKQLCINDQLRSKGGDLDEACREINESGVCLQGNKENGAD